jgi:hypothetical protein
MKRRSLCLAVVSAIAGGALAEAPRVARAADPKSPDIEISVIHALRTDASAFIDPALRDLPQLTKEQPFVRYNVFKLLDRKKLPLVKGKPAAYAVVDGRTLQVTLVDVAGQSGAERYHLRAEIAGPDKKEFLKLLEVTASPNEPFFVAGQSHAGGTLFLELTLR